MLAVLIARRADADAAPHTEQQRTMGRFNGRFHALPVGEEYPLTERWQSIPPAINLPPGVNSEEGTGEVDR